jgi:hypothetical protein
LLRDALGLFLLLVDAAVFDFSALLFSDVTG